MSVDTSPSCVLATDKQLCDLQWTDFLKKGVILFMGKTQNRLCPVAATSAYLAVHGSSPGPFFTFKEGIPLYRELFVARVRSALTVAGIQAFQLLGIASESERCPPLQLEGSKILWDDGEVLRTRSIKSTGFLNGGFNRRTCVLSYLFCTVNSNRYMDGKTTGHNLCSKPTIKRMVWLVDWA